MFVIHDTRQRIPKQGSHSDLHFLVNPENNGAAPFRGRNFFLVFIRRFPSGSFNGAAPPGAETAAFPQAGQPPGSSAALNIKWSYPLINLDHPARDEGSHPRNPLLGFFGPRLPGQPYNLLQPPKLPRRNLMIVFGVIQQFENHGFDMRGLVL